MPISPIFWQYTKLKTLPDLAEKQKQPQIQPKPHKNLKYRCYQH
jgi:hypothetical protein